MLQVPITMSCLLILQTLWPEHDEYYFLTEGQVPHPEEQGNHPENKIVFV